MKGSLRDDIVKPHPRTTSIVRPGVRRLEVRKKREEERPLYDATLARGYANVLVEYFHVLGYRVAIAGSLRRGHRQVHDIDILIASNVWTHVELAGIPPPELIAVTPSKVSFRHPKMGIVAEVRNIPMASWGSALQYYTGSREHNIWLRALARRRGLSLSEYGFRHVLKDGNLGVIMPVPNESEVYKTLGLRWLPPAYRDKRHGGKDNVQ